MPDPYAFYLYAKELPELLVALNNEERELRVRGHPALADKLLKAYGVLIGDLEYLAAAVAGAGTLKLVETEKATKVRPDSLGGGGPRLEDFLQCDPLVELPGSVGVANEAVLDAGVPWWPTNEEGSTARVGGHIFGQFYDAGFGGGTAPDGSLSRIHPIFQPTTVEGSGPGIIHNPIPARRFIRDSIPSIEARWFKGFEAAKRKLEDALTEIFAALAAEAVAEKAKRGLP
jgi:hypothetical protein